MSKGAGRFPCQAFILPRHGTGSVFRNRSIASITVRPVSERRIVVVRAGDRDESLRLGRRVEDASALRIGDDGVLVPGDHQQGTAEAGDAARRVEAIAQQPAHGQQRIVEGADVRHRGERRAQHQRRRPVLRGEPRGDAAAERFPEVHQARRRGLGAGEEEGPRRPRILGEPCLGRRAGIPAVAPVVEEQDTVSALAQRRGQRRAEPAMPGVAVEDEDGGAGARLERRHQPAVQPEAVRRGKHHGFGRLEPDETGAGTSPKGK